MAKIASEIFQDSVAPEKGDLRDYFKNKRKLMAREFGVTLDGVTDDLTALHAALAVASSFGGGEVVLDAGAAATFVATNGNLVIPANCGLVAEGDVTIRPHLDEAAFGSAGMVSMSDNTWLRGITFTSEKSDGTRVSGHQLFHRTTTLGRTAKKVRFENCKFTAAGFDQVDPEDGNAGYDCAYLGTGVEDWSFYNCEFTDAGRNNLSIISGNKMRFYECLFGGAYILYNVDLEANLNDPGIYDNVFEDCIIDCSQTEAFEKSIIIKARDVAKTERVYMTRCRIIEGNLRFINRDATTDMDKVYVKDCDIDGILFVDAGPAARGLNVKDTKFGGALSGGVVDSHFDNVTAQKNNLNMSGTTVFENGTITGASNNVLNIYIRDKSKFLNNTIYSLADVADDYAAFIRLTNPTDDEFAGRGEQIVGNRFLNGGGEVKPWRLFYLSSLALVANNVFEDGTTSTTPVDLHVKIGEGQYQHFTGTAAPTSGTFPRGAVSFPTAAGAGLPARHTCINSSGSGTWVTEYLPAFGSKTWDPPSLAAGASQTTTVTCTGAAIGDAVSVGFGASMAGTVMTGYVNAADTVTVTHFNPTGGAVDLGSATVRVKAEKIGA